MKKIIRITERDITRIVKQVINETQQQYSVNLQGVPQVLIDAMSKYGIVSPLEQAHFLAQCRAESDNWKATTEYASGSAYENRCKDLGNCSKGDGVKYKGRGYIQLTGKSNYTEYDKNLKERGITDDVVKNPDLVATKYAGDVSAWYWKVYGPKFNKNFTTKSQEGADQKTVDKIGSWVNGKNPPNGYLARRNFFNKLLIKNYTPPEDKDLEDSKGLPIVPSYPPPSNVIKRQ